MPFQPLYFHDWTLPETSDSPTFVDDLTQLAGEVEWNVSLQNDYHLIRQLQAYNGSTSLDSTRGTNDTHIPLYRQFLFVYHYSSGRTLTLPRAKPRPSYSSEYPAAGGMAIQIFDMYGLMASYPVTIQGFSRPADAASLTFSITPNASNALDWSNRSSQIVVKVNGGAAKTVDLTGRSFTPATLATFMTTAIGGITIRRPVKGKYNPKVPTDAYFELYTSATGASASIEIVSVTNDATPNTPTINLSLQTKTGSNAFQERIDGSTTRTFSTSYGSLRIMQNTTTSYNTEWFTV